jgi:hypothetical protein
LHHAVPEAELLAEDVVNFCNNGVVMANNEDATIHDNNIFVVGYGN